MEDIKKNTIELDTIKLDEEGFKRTKPDSPKLMVAADTPPKRLAKTIVGNIKEFGYCELHCVLHGPTWQGMKGLICATDILEQDGIKVHFDAVFMEPRPIIAGITRTGIIISIYPTVDDSISVITDDLESQGIIQV